MWSHKKHILFLTWKDIEHPHAGWAERVIFEYAKRLTWEWHRVTWFASTFNGATPYAKKEGIEIIRKYSAHTVWMFAWYWYHSWKQSNPVDIIIDEAGGWPLLSPLFEYQVPISFFIHHIGDKEFDQYPFPIGTIAKWLYRFFISLYKKNRTITVSDSTRDELIHDFAFEKENISVIENTVELETIHAVDMETKTKDFVFLWRLTKIKRPLDAIRAFARIIALLPEDSHLHIIGNAQDKVYESIMHKYCEKYHLNDRVIFHGFMPTDERQEQVKKCRAIIVPSEKEWYGLVVLEANAVGTPAIVYNVAGLRDSTKDDINGMIVPYGDIDTLSKSMLEMLGNEHKYEKLCRSSLEYAKKLPSWDHQYQKFQSIITK